MKALKLIQGGGYYGDLDLRGTRRDSRNKDTALYINLKEGEVAEFGDIKTRGVFNPGIITGLGKVVIHSIDNKDFGGDGIQGRTSHIHIKYTNVERVTPTRPYKVCERVGNETIAQCLARNNEVVFDPSILEWERHPNYATEIIAACHVDAVIQLYSTLPNGYTLNPAGIITDIRMPNVRAVIDHPKVQVVMGSENNDYSDIHIGTERLELEMPYIMPVVFNTLRDSVIGCKDASVPDGCCVKIKEVKPRPDAIPVTEKRTFGNRILGFRAECIIEQCNGDSTGNAAHPKSKNEDDMITPELLMRLGVSRANANQWASPLKTTAMVYGLNIPTVAEDWLAQLVHESQEFTRLRESLYYTTPSRLVSVWPKRFSLNRVGKKLCATDYVRNSEKLANEVYACRMGNGDAASGDGFRFSGGGLGMLTGREMWQAYADFSGNDVVNNPHLFEDKLIAADSAGWMFAVAKGLIDEAKADLVGVITKRINGGHIGLDHRKRLTAEARAYFVEKGFDLNKPSGIHLPSVTQAAPPVVVWSESVKPQPKPEKPPKQIIKPITDKLSGKKTHIGMFISAALGVAGMFGFMPGMTADQGAGMIQAAFGVSGFRSAIPKLIVLAIETFLKLKKV